MTLLQPFISHTFEGHIWRMQIDEANNILALEIRNEQEKQASFASFDLLRGQCYFSNFNLPEPWLIGIEAVYNGIILLHYYKHKSSPEHKGLIAIDAKTGKQLWANYNITFDHLTANGPVVHNANIQPKRLELIGTYDGRILKNFWTEWDKPLASNIVIPEMVAQQDVVPGILLEQPYGNMVHYISHNGYIIISLHSLKSGVLQQHLYVMIDGQIVYQDLLNSNIQKLQPEAFVVHNNALVYVKEKARLMAVQL